MKKYKLELSQDDAKVVRMILHAVKTSDAPIPGLELETLCCCEFYEKHMPALHFPQRVTKLSMPGSYALALVRMLEGFDMRMFDEYLVICRDGICDRLYSQFPAAMAGAIMRIY